MRYLYIEKRQRVSTEGELSRRATSIATELTKLGVDFDVSHFDEVTVTFDAATHGTTIKALGKDILTYSHIIFGGHHLHGKGYELKRMIVDLVDTHNAATTPDKQINVQNSGWIKKLPFYSKLSMAKLCLDYDLPHLTTHYSFAGDYDKDVAPLAYPVIAKHVDGENDLVEIDGKMKVKKNVFKVEDPEGWKQERLAEKELSDFIIQEFTPVGEDLRIFVANGEVVGGWRRVAGEDNFMTVTKGSEYYYYNDPAPEIRDICQMASKAWDVDFMALDFIYKDNKPYILEFSMNPGFHAYETKCLEGEPANIGEAIVGAV